MNAANRGVLRAQATKICTSVEECLAAPVNEETRQELNILRSRLKNVHDRLLSADRALESTIAAADMQREVEQMVEYDDKVVSTLAKIDYVLQELNIRAVQGDQNARCQSVVENMAIVYNSLVEVSSIKLKPIELKKFDGNFENWLPFWEQFKIAVHENKELDFISKFNYLSACLIGKAAASITEFLPSQRCYDDAIKLLLEEFGDREKIIGTYKNF